MSDLTRIDASEATVVVERLFASPVGPTDDDRRYYRSLRTRIPRTGLLDALHRAGTGLDQAGKARHQRVLAWVADELSPYVATKPNPDPQEVSEAIRKLDAASLFALMLRMRRVLRRAEQLSQAWQKRERAADRGGASDSVAAAGQPAGREGAGHPDVDMATETGGGEP